MPSETSLPDNDNPDTLICLFNALFEPTLRTRLVRGDDEPIYTPAAHPDDVHRIVFARGYFASALHEISHWCVAGHARRQQEDYGYWYIPDGRDACQQARFEQAEIKPQAIESLLAAACGRSFHVSVDNLDGDVEVDREAFAAKVAAQAEQYRQHGVSARTQIVIDGMTAYYRCGASIEETTAALIPRLRDVR